MSEQQFQGTLASGGTFIATAQGIRILDPAGNQLASFGREVISGIGRDGQVVTVERYSDSIVTLTTASITDAVGLEQYVRDTITAPQPPPVTEQPSPPLAFDAFDDDAPGAPPEPPRPQIISRLDPTYDAGTTPEHEIPEPVPTSPPVSSTPGPPAAAPPPGRPPEPLPGTPHVPAAPPGQYGAPPPPSAELATEEKEGGRRLWLWGCLGCGGLLVLALICIGVLAATDAIDVDELTGDDATPTPFIIVATTDDADATPTPDTEAGDEPAPTDDEGASGDSPTLPPPAGGVMSEGQTGSLSGFDVTFLGSRTDTGGIFPPDPGNEYLILRFQLENTTAEATFVSTLLQFALLNEASEEFGVALFADIEEGLDTEVPAGETIEGEVAFEIPEGSGSYTIAYQDLISDSTLQWAVN